MLTELIANIKRIPAGKKSDSLDVLEERLLSWIIAVKILYTAVSLTKVSWDLKSIQTFRNINFERHVYIGIRRNKINSTEEHRHMLQHSLA